MKKLMGMISTVWLLAALPVYAGKYIASSGIPVENQFIVVLKDDAPSLQAREALLQNFATQHGGELIRAYTVALNGGVLRMNEAKAKALANHPLISYIEQDTVVQLIVPTITSTQTGTPFPSWGLDRIDQHYLPMNDTYNYTNDGTGVNAYVIDTGIRYSHSEFGGRAKFGFDAFGKNGSDCNGHGTHVAGTIGGINYGVAKNVNLIVVRVLNCAGSGTTSGVIAGIDWVTANATRPAVANMSLGGGISSALDSAVTTSINSGVIYAIAAGNSNANACNYSPARVAGAITVGATTSVDGRASYSNYGSCLDLFAPGSGITSAWKSSDTATNTISGTSMATPHVSGVIALILQGSTDATPAAVAIALTDKSTKDAIGSAGTNSPNRLLFTDY